MTLERGYLLNRRYRIVEILGQGGMAAVYRAVDENLGVEVAVKENLFTTEEYARQFRREAVILANLRHPNLPRVTDHFVIEQQGQYLVMDYIEGEDLRQRMERIGTLPDQDVVIIGAALCDALTYLHTRNPQVLHRDIKPGNVKITPGGQIYLVDFGLAKVVSGRQATTTGARAMTPGYSPPEQYGTARTDHRSDIYSLGATMYSALTDAIPEDGLARAMEQSTLTPLLKRSPKITKRLATAIEKALAVRPDDRYQNAEDFKTELLNCRSTTRRNMPLDLTLEPPPAANGNGAALDDAEDALGYGAGGVAYQEDLLSFPISTSLKDLPFQPPVRRVLRFNGVLWLLGGLLLAVVMLVLAAIVNPELGDRALAWLGADGRQPSATVTPATATLSVAVLPPATSTPTSTPTSVPPSPTRPTNTLTKTPVPHTKTPTFTSTPTITPTPQGSGWGQIAFASNRSGSSEIHLANLLDGSVQQLTDIGEGACQPSWSPDGLRLVFVSPCPDNRNSGIYNGSGLFIINADGSGLTPLPSAPGGDFMPAWSPDGERIAFVSSRQGNIPMIYIMDLADFSVTQVTQDELKQNTFPSWSPDGKELAFIGSDSQLRVMAVDGSGRFQLVRNAGTTLNSEVAWSPSGQNVVFTQRSADGSNSWLMAVQYNPEGSPPTRIPNSQYMAEASFSPDGLWLVVTGYPTGVRDIYIFSLSGAGLRPVIQDEFYDFDPAWRPGQP